MTRSRSRVERLERAAGAGQEEVWVLDRTDRRESSGMCQRVPVHKYGELLTEAEFDALPDDRPRVLIVLVDAEDEP